MLVVLKHPILHKLKHLLALCPCETDKKSMTHQMIFRSLSSIRDSLPEQKKILQKSCNLNLNENKQIREQSYNITSFYTYISIGKETI